MKDDYDYGPWEDYLEYMVLAIMNRISPLSFSEYKDAEVILMYIHPAPLEIIKFYQMTGCFLTPSLLKAIYNHKTIKT